MTNSTTKAGHKFVSRVAYGEEQVQQDQVLVADFGGEPTGMVTVGSKFTKNLGNYQSATVTIEVSLPCLASEEEAVRVYGICAELVGEMLQEQVDSIN